MRIQAAVMQGPRADQKPRGRSANTDAHDHQNNDNHSAVNTYTQDHQTNDNHSAVNTYTQDHHTNDNHSAVNTYTQGHQTNDNHSAVNTYTQDHQNNDNHSAVNTCTQDHHTQITNQLTPHVYFNTRHSDSCWGWCSNTRCHHIDQDTHITLMNPITYP